MQLSGARSPWVVMTESCMLWKSTTNGSLRVPIIRRAVEAWRHRRRAKHRLVHHEAIIVTEPRDVAHMAMQDLAISESIQLGCDNSFMTSLSASAPSKIPRVSLASCTKQAWSR